MGEHGLQLGTHRNNDTICLTIVLQWEQLGILGYIVHTMLQRSKNHPNVNTHIELVENLFNIVETMVTPVTRHCYNTMIQCINWCTQVLDSCEPDAEMVDFINNNTDTDCNDLVKQWNSEEQGSAIGNKVYTMHRAIINYTVTVIQCFDTIVNEDKSKMKTKIVTVLFHNAVSSLYQIALEYTC